MVDILYLGDQGYHNVVTAFDIHNRWNNGSLNLEAHEVPLGGFQRATEEGLRRWLKNEVPGYPSLLHYDGVVVDSLWINLLPVVKEAHPNAPVVMLLGCHDGEYQGVDVHLPFSGQILELASTLEGLIQH